MSASQNNDRWIKCISQVGNVRGVAIQATDLINQMAESHGIRGQSVQALGEAVMGALLISSYCKGGERINLNIRGSGLIMQGLVDAYPDGTVRGYVIERELTQVNPDAKRMGPWGEGLLSVLRTKKSEGQQPYIGTVPLITGHLAKDLTFYWLQSEQIPSAVGLAVNLDQSGRVFSAGGFLVQALPGATDKEIKAIEQHIHEIQSFAHNMAMDSDPLHLLSKIFQDSTFLLLEEKPLTFKCTCSIERVERALALTGVAELESMLAEKGHAEVRCDFCSKTYRVDAANLKKLIQNATKS